MWANYAPSTFMRRSLLFLLLCPLQLWCAPVITAPEYIETWKNEAIYQMALHKIPASITLAQGLLESGNGNSRLATEGNNHFGIKCHNDWSGKKIYEDDETRGECFRKYNDPRESFEDHSLFLKKNRYAPLFELDTDDYKAWAKGLKNCGYATNPKYPQLLIDLIERYNLHQYDEAGMKYIKKNELPDHKESSKKPPIKPTEEDDSAADSRKEISIGNNRTVMLSANRIKFIKAKAGDTPEKIADELEIGAWQIYKYNDMAKGKKLNEGDIIYIQPKRNKAKENTYTIKSGDTMREISQRFGVKMNKLLKRNGLHESDTIHPGQVIRLR